MNKDTLVFYRLGNFSDDYSMGSVYRVNTIQTALSRQNVSIEIVSGNGSERLAQLKLLLKKQENKEISLFGLYGESSNLTILLSNEKYNLLHGLREMHLLYKLGKKIPIAIFYRDCYWKVLGLRRKIELKYIYKYLAHWIEWFLFRFIIDLLYVPSLDFSEYLTHGKYAIKALPPGIIESDTGLPLKKVKSSLLYVGGCKPPYYDISNLLKCSNDRVSEIIIVTRESEWMLNSHYYGKVGPKVRMIHVSGEKLKSLYAEVDIFVDLRDAWGNDYFRSSMPLKFFEALGFGKPIILMKGSVIADVIAENKLGYVLNSVNELDAAISYIEENYVEIGLNIRQFNNTNSWNRRAEQIISDLKCI